MKRILIAFLAILFAQLSEAQTQKYSTFYVQRASLFSKLAITPKDIVFIGNSITNGAEWSELFPQKRVKNRGISGNTSEGVYLLKYLSSSVLTIFLVGYRSKLSS